MVVVQQNILWNMQRLNPTIPSQLLNQHRAQNDRIWPGRGVVIWTSPVKGMFVVIVHEDRWSAQQITKFWANSIISFGRKNKMFGETLYSKCFMRLRIFISISTIICWEILFCSDPSSWKSHGTLLMVLDRGSKGTACIPKKRCKENWMCAPNYTPDRKVMTKLSTLLGNYHYSPYFVCFQSRYPTFSVQYLSKPDNNTKTRASLETEGEIEKMCKHMQNLREKD